MYPDKTASEGTVWYVSTLFACHFVKNFGVWSFRTFTIFIAPDKALFSPKSTDILLISSWKCMLWVLIRSTSIISPWKQWCGHLLELRNQDVSNECPQHTFLWNNQGPVVQSVVSLTSSLRVISLTVLADSIYNILIFFAEKMWVAFALQKLLTFFQQKISAYLRITWCKF